MDELTLAEALFLLALDPSSGRLCGRHLPRGLAGALLAELALLNRVSIRADAVELFNPNHTGIATLDAVLDCLIVSRHPTDLAGCLVTLARHIDRIDERVANRLMAYRVLDRTSQDAPARYTVRDGGRRQALTEHIRAIVLHAVEPALRDTLLVSLLGACDLLATLFSREEREQARLRLFDLTAGEPVGAALRLHRWI